MEISEVRRLKELEAENARLRRIVTRRTRGVRKAMDNARSKSCCGETGEPGAQAGRHAASADGGPQLAAPRLLARWA